MTTRPITPLRVDGHRTKRAVLEPGRAKELAALADSIAERADRMADRVSWSGWSEERQAFHRQAGYAEGVRDALLWLAGDRPADLLTDVLDVDPETQED